MSSAPTAANSSYATNEPADQLWFEQSVNAAVYIGAMAWGLHAAVFYQVMQAIVQDKSRRHYRWLPLVVILFVLALVNICCNIRFDELAWIDDRNYPGGPIGFLTGQSSHPLNIASVATSIIVLFFADLFLIYRCHVLWNKLYITLVLSAVLLASTVFSILHCIQAAKPTSGLWDDDLLSLSVPYASLAMSLNILLSLCLSWRLFDYRRRLPTSITPDAARYYGSIEALIVESALPYGLVSLVFVVLYGLQSTAANLFGPLLVQLEGIAPGLIIMRMVRGHSWSSNTLRQVGPSSAVFRGQLGRQMNAPGFEDVSMMTLGNNDVGTKHGAEVA
ncbi:hypothetical protein CERSUDRAFT_116494 [Gelatoporia subvermispora B]|uniref:Uncharacterized protein n=1 Tax=Ceriporiopsis subvermispora (strain B) TaxID=914234 RepID=M2QSG2_CERS8|nr:hypothetical protein CERSUDRAFT_116494 [Gelatoporia subvermispora B]